MANGCRLIDAYKLEDLVRSNSARYHHVDDVIAAIAGQPTVDTVEVVHGRWIGGYMGTTYTVPKCSQCGYGNGAVGAANYCPNCGAKMAGGNENG